MMALACMLLRSALMLLVVIPATVALTDVVAVVAGVVVVVVAIVAAAVRAYTLWLDGSTRALAFALSGTSCDKAPW